MTTAVAPALNFDALLPEGETLFDYQHVGVAYALVARRCFIADEQGLGKTRQALVAAEASNAFPLVVVCKASLKGNWEREVNRCLPHRSVQILGGRRPYETYADVVIVNYDILAAWADYLDPEALVLDESHYCKERGTAKKPVQRTAAALALAGRVPDHGLVLLLTGTPLLNRPVELVTQLQILGRLQEVSPRPRKGDSDRDWEYAFKFTFCGPTQSNGHYEFKGASNLDMLNERLRAACYVRRLRHDVLGMNETRRIAVPLSLNGALDTYRAAEADLISFLRREKGEDAAQKARYAEILVSLNTLRQLAGKAKIEAAAEWIQDFLEENPKRKLVVFAWHIDVQKAIAERVGGIYLKGAKDIEAAKAEFNDGDARVIVCSLQAHREGHTLVANGKAQDVLFIEQPWHPGAVSQAEDRINRIGQTAEQVFAWTLLAASTIDEDIAELITSKWQVFKAAADGRPVDVQEQDIVNEVIDRLRQRAEGN